MDIAFLLRVKYIFFWFYSYCEYFLWVWAIAVNSLLVISTRFLSENQAVEGEGYLI